jgi:Tfp pilus assembly protein PilN
MRAVNLLPPDLRTAPKKVVGSPAAREAPPGIGAYLVLGALALAVAAVAVVALAGNTLGERRAQLGTVTAEAQNAQQRAAALRPYADYQAAAEARAATVRGIAGARFDWHQALQGLSRALPRDAALSAMTGTVAPGTGGGSNPLRSAVTAPAIELSGCTSGQTGVARLMSRLRNVDGVTRVTLSKAFKNEEGTGGAPAGAAGTVYCGERDPANFEVVVFFERDAARVAAAPGATVGATPGQPPAPSASKPASGANPPTTDGGTE